MKEKLEEYFSSIKLPATQYPEKQHGIEDTRKEFKESTKKIIEILDLENINIAIKNIITKIMVRFICSYRSAYSNDSNKDFNIQETDTGFTVSCGNNTLCISVIESEIIISNNCEKLRFSTLGEDYSKIVLIINRNEPNIVRQHFQTKTIDKETYSTAVFVSEFNEDGLEQQKAFNLSFYENSKITVNLEGFCERDEYFPVTVGIQNYYDSDISKEEKDEILTKIKAEGQKKIPAVVLNETGADSNMIFNYSDIECMKLLVFKEKLIGYYTKDNKSYDVAIKRMKANNYSIIKSHTTDVNFDDVIMCRSRIDGGYSEEIMTNIKKYMNIDSQNNKDEGASKKA